MKDIRYANRGQTLEIMLRTANELYERRLEAVIRKVPTEFIPIRDKYGKICNVKVENKAPADFIGRYKQYPIAIEAKNTNDDYIRFDRVEDHQADFMDGFTSCPGTIGLVVVSFNYERFYAVPWTFWQAAYNARVRRGASRTSPVTVKAFGQCWTIPKKFSVREEELNPLWRVPDHMQYLIYADRYTTP